VSSAGQQLANYCLIGEIVVRNQNLQRASIALQYVSQIRRVFFIARLVGVRRMNRVRKMFDRWIGV
jgi:hypothetical protein